MNNYPFQHIQIVIDISKNISCVDSKAYCYKNDIVW